MEISNNKMSYKSPKEQYEISSLNSKETIFCKPNDIFP